ncbi:MAG TPA: hypothetical protein VNJ51_11465 [Candidatus Dormibacteraeota bacterium]|nr:hypothetical protein [Candidatus Dormibacteraeota bacterium]
MHIARVRALGASLVVALLLALGVRGAFADTAAPVVVVFPFQPNGNVPEKMGEQIATLLAQHIADGGQVVVKAAPAASTPKTFQHDAQAAGAAYYVTGYVTPFAGGVSLVEYVVSARTGTAVYSATATAGNATDIESQAYVLKQALLAITAPPPSTADAGPAPTATATPAAAAATREAAAAVAGQRWVVVEVGGGGDAAQRTQARQALIASLKGKGVVAVADDDPAPEGPALARVICEQNGGARLVAATLRNVRGARSFDGSIDATLLDCATGAAQRTVSGSGRSVEQAAQAAASALVAPPPKRR